MKPMKLDELKESYEWTLDKMVRIIKNPEYKTKVFGRYTHESESGMTRWLVFYAIWGTELHNVTGLIAATLGERVYSKGCQDGIKRGGCGYNAALDVWMSFLWRLHELGLISEEEAKNQSVQTLY